MTGVTWFKSSYSGSQGGNCVEIAYDWRKSSYSGSEGGNCVEVASGCSAIHIRDSKDTAGPILTVRPAAWAAFTQAAAKGDVAAGPR
ncbi:DUF397 domain-containing protein [Streptomyces sp. NPDC048172]|uniref:DUF397 domain-containing protein n=1 Tax=Streptomyces sp. NPDC048172 TaxID=3365505 RepID=UPI00371B46AC